MNRVRPRPVSLVHAGGPDESDKGLQRGRWVPVQRVVQKKAGLGGTEFIEHPHEAARLHQWRDEPVGQAGEPMPQSTASRRMPVSSTVNSASTATSKAVLFEPLTADWSFN